MFTHSNHRPVYVYIYLWPNYWLYLYTCIGWSRRRRRRREMNSCDWGGSWVWQVQTSILYCSTRGNRSVAGRSGTDRAHTRCVRSPATSYNSEQQQQQQPSSSSSSPLYFIRRHSAFQPNDWVVLKYFESLLLLRTVFTLRQTYTIFYGFRIVHAGVCKFRFES